MNRRNDKQLIIDQVFALMEEDPMNFGEFNARWVFSRKQMDPPIWNKEIPKSSQRCMVRERYVVNVPIFRDHLWTSFALDIFRIGHLSQARMKSLHDRAIVHVEFNISPFSAMERRLFSKNDRYSSGW